MIQYNPGWAADATGFVAVAVIAIALVASARMKWLTRHFGIGSVLGVHRGLGIAAVVAVMAHIGFVLVMSPFNLVLLFPWLGTAASKAADGATVALIALMLAGRWWIRRYDRWRRWHTGFAVVAVLLAALHIYFLHHMVDEWATLMWFVAVALMAGFAVVVRWVWRPLSNTGFTVTEVHPESPTVSTVTLTPRRGRHRGGRRSVQFVAGQFGWLRFTRRPSADHPFTFSSSAHNARNVQVTVKRGTEFADDLTASSPGRRVWVDGPHGGFSPSDDAVGMVLISGGVGITPMISILRTCADRRDPRSIRLVVAADSPHELLFGAEVAELRKRLNLTVVPVISRPYPGWNGLVGHVGPALLEQAIPGQPLRGQFDHLVCGPPQMVADTVTALTLLGVPRSRVHTEQFLMSNPKKGGSRARHAQTSPRGAVGGPRRPVPRGGHRLGDTAPLPAVGPRQPPPPPPQQRR